MSNYDVALTEFYRMAVDLSKSLDHEQNEKLFNLICHVENMLEVDNKFYECQDSR